MSQGGGLVLHTLENPCPGFLFTQGVPEASRGDVTGLARKSGDEELPAFLSPAPPRSEGEALLRRIFTRGEAL
jgi:hypothetical protein